MIMNPYIYIIPFLLALISLEMLVANQRGLKVYRFQDTLVSINVGVVSQFVNTIGGVISVTMYSILVARYGAFTWDESNPLTWILGLVIYDFFYYWVHRAGHEINIAWAAHVVHHSSEEFNLSTALRQSATGFYFKWIFYIPLALLGFSVKMFIVLGLIDLIYQYWVHTQLIGRLGFLEKFLVTPSNHRVHHGQNDYCLDKNYGGILSIWDQFFGTYADERENEKPVYGVRKPLRSWNAVWGNLHHYEVIFKQVKAMTQWRDKLMVVFAPPRWRPDSDSTPEELFDHKKFERFNTLSSKLMRSIGVITTLLGAVLLANFLMIQSHLELSIRLGYSAVMLCGYVVVGWVWSIPSKERV